MKIFDLLGTTHHTGEGSMRIRMIGTPGTGVRGEKGEHLAAGETYSVSDSFGHQLVASGRARRVAERDPVVAPDEVQIGDPVATHRDPKPARRRRK